MKPVVFLVIFFCISPFCSESSKAQRTERLLITEKETPVTTKCYKESPKSLFYSFRNVEEARKVLPEYSPYFRSLDDEWSFFRAPNQQSYPTGFQQPDYDASRWGVVHISPTFEEGKQTPEYSNYSMSVSIPPPNRPNNKQKEIHTSRSLQDTSRNNNKEIACYRRNFICPYAWKGQTVYACFYGMDSFFHLWINGKYAGFSQESPCVARFNITSFLHKGNNTIAVEVHPKNGNASQNIHNPFYFPGKFRSVSLEAEPQVCIADLRYSIDCDNNFKNTIINITASVRNSSHKNLENCRIRYSLFQNKLYSDDNLPKHVLGDTLQEIGALKQGGTIKNEVQLAMLDGKFWSAEEPWRYTLTAELLDKKGNILQAVSTYIGIRKSNIHLFPNYMDEYDLAGRYYNLNGETVKLKGINRNEEEPETGRAVSHSFMLQEILQMKRANINTVRTTAHLTSPFWYYLCDKYGIYVICENNYSIPQKPDTAHIFPNSTWEKDMTSRNTEMATVLYNHPSIILWSLGNPGNNRASLPSLYKHLHSIDNTRPILCWKDNNISDASTCIPSSSHQIRNMADGKENSKYPFFIQEYNLSSGDTPLNLEECWKIIDSNNRIMGGCLWSWRDSVSYIYDSVTNTQRPKVKKFYGKFPENGHFDTNGLLFFGLGKKALYYEVKYLYQDIQVDNIAPEKGYFSIKNKNYFKTLNHSPLHWSITEDGKEIQQGDMNLPELKPRGITTIQVPFNSALFNKKKQYVVHFQFPLKEDTPWEKKGYVQAEEHIRLFSKSTGNTVSAIQK